MAHRFRTLMWIVIGLIALRALTVLVSYLRQRAYHREDTTLIQRDPPCASRYGMLSWRGLRLEADTGQGRHLFWQAPYPILRVINVDHPRAGPALLVLTAEQPRRRQPLRSRLYLLSGEMESRERRDRRRSRRMLPRRPSATVGVPFVGLFGEP